MAIPTFRSNNPFAAIAFLRFRLIFTLLLTACSVPAIHAGTTLSTSYAGTTVGYASFDLNSQIYLANGNAGISGTSNVHVTVANSSLTIDRINGSLGSASWSGSGNFVNPSSQTVGVTLNIVTNPTTFSISSTRALALSGNSNGQLAWSAGTEFAGTVSSFTFSGSYTLSGPTQTVTGTFSHVIGSRGLNSDGLLRYPSEPGQIELSGGLAAFFPSTFASLDLPLVNGTVDGVHITASTFGIRSNMGADFGNQNQQQFTALQVVPEPTTTMMLACAGVVGGLRRRR